MLDFPTVTEIQRIEFRFLKPKLRKLRVCLVSCYLYVHRENELPINSAKLLEFYNEIWVIRSSDNNMFFCLALLMI